MAGVVAVGARMTVPLAFSMAPGRVPRIYEMAGEFLAAFCEPEDGASR
jgi:hypothetical protein